MWISDRCVRVLCQDNDTGGFFVALLRKVGEVSRIDRRVAAAALAKEGEEPDRKRAKLEEG